MAVIESSPLLFSPAKEPESLTELRKGNPEPLERGLIQFTQPDYMLFPSEDGVSTIGFPSLPAPPGFIQNVHPGDIPEPAGTSSVFDSQDVLRLSLLLSPINRVPSGASVECLSSSSTVASDDSDGDAGLLSALLGPPSFGLAQHISESSDLSYYSVINSSARLTQIGSPRPVPRWRLAREGPFLLKISPSGGAGFGHGCAFRSTTYQPSDYAQPSGKYGLPLHHPRFLNVP